MLRKLLMTSALAVPALTLVPALAAAQDQAQQQQQQPGASSKSEEDMSYGEKARANQPESVEEIRGINSGPRQAAQFEDKDVIGGDPTFALPATSLIGDDLATGDETEAGDIVDVVLSDDGTIMAAVDLEGDDTVLVPFTVIRVQTGRGPENWMLVTGMTPSDLAELPRYDESRRGTLTSVSDVLIGTEVTADGGVVGDVSDAIVHSTAGIQGLVIDRDERRVMIPAGNLIVRAGQDGAVDISTDLAAVELAELPDYVFGDAPAAITAPGSAAAGLAGELVIGENEPVERGAGEPTASEMLPEAEGDRQMNRPMQAEGESMEKVLEVIRPTSETDHTD